MISPAPGATLDSLTVTFWWNAGSGAADRYFAVGTTLDGNDIYGGYQGQFLSKTVSGLPGDGRTIYVTLMSYTGGAWVTNRYTYTAVTAVVSRITCPLQALLPSSTVTFGWSQGTAVADRYLMVGSTQGGSQYYAGYQGSATAREVTGLPTAGELIWVRLMSYVGGWQYTDYEYYGGSIAQSTITCTQNGSTLTSPNLALYWTPGTGVADRYLMVGTVAGGSDIYSGSQGSASSRQFTVPTNGSTIYVRLMSFINGGWQWNYDNYYVTQNLGLVLDPASSILFPPTYYGTSSANSTVTLRNTGATALTLSSIATGGIDFRLGSNSCGTTLASQATCTVNVYFNPTALGTRGGVLTVASNAAGSPHQLLLSGTGTGPTYAGAPIDDVNAGGSGGDGTATSVGSSRNNDSKPQGAFAPSGLKDGDGGDGTGPDDQRGFPWTRGHPGGVPCETRDCLIWVDGHRPGVGDPFFGGFFQNHNSGGTRTGEPKDPKDPACDKSASVTSDSFPDEKYQQVLLALNDHGSNVEIPESEFVLDPVHSGTGNKHHLQLDYAGQDRWPLVAVRTYNSQPFQSSAMVRAYFGPGWFSNWDKSIIVSGTSARVSRGDGKSFVFNWNGTAWAAVNSRSQLQQLTSGGSTTGWRYTTKAGDVENFDAQGRLTSVAALTGETYTLTYNAAGDRLQSVQNPLGRSIQFAYDTNGRVVTLIDPAGNQATYTYDFQGRLATATYPDGHTRQYNYADSTNAFALTSIVDEVGQTYATFGYYSDNRAWTNSFAGSVGQGSISYPSGTSSSTTTPDGTNWTRAFAVTNGKVQMSSLTPSCGDCGSASDNFEYDNLGQLWRYTNRSGIVTTYTYNDRGLPLTITEGGIRSRTYTWHPTLNLPTQVAGQLSTTNYTYDAAGRTTQKTLSGGGISRTWTYAYDAQGRLTQERGPRTDVLDTTNYTYDAAGNIATVTNALGQVTRYTSYDAHGNALGIAYPNGTTAILAYDVRGRLTSKTLAGQTTTYSYNTVGNLASEIDPAGVVTSYTYDAAHRLTRTTRLGEATVYTLDGSGRTIKTEIFDSTNFLVRTSSVAYDGLGRVKQRIGANGQVTQYTYDDRGNPSAVVDPLGNTTSTGYDALNRPILVTDPLLHTVQTTYDDNDKVTSIRDPDGNTTTYTNNAIGEQAGISSPDTALTTIALNSAGMVATKTDARGTSATYTYDALGRITQTSFSDGAGITRSYDVAANGVGRLAQMTDPSGTTSYTYDLFGRTASKTQVVSGISKTITYGRDSIGRVTSITYPSGKILAITYQNGRIVSLTFDGQTIASGIQYFPFGAPESWLFGGTKEYTRYIDKDGRIASYITPSGQRNLTFDAAGRITRIDNVVSNTITGSQTFTYDALGRVLTFSGYTSASVSETQSFTYDANGNRLTNTLDGVALTYNYTAGTNHLATVTSGGSAVVSNTFDASGNTTSDGARTFTYDARGRMVQATSGGITTSYLYNGNGQRVKKSNANLSHIFVYDDSGHIVGEYDGTGTTIQELVWLGDTPLAVITSSTTGFIWTDHLNTPREITNSSNQSLWKWDSLPFGETAPNENPAAVGVFQFNHRFPGQYFDQEWGGHQNGVREYDPRLGRYVEADPAGLSAGPNLYTYVKNAPTNAVDPSGLFACKDYGDQFFDTFFSFHETLADEALKVIFGLGGLGAALAAEVNGMTAMQALRHIVTEYVFSPAAFRAEATFQAVGQVLTAQLVRGMIVSAIGTALTVEAGLALGASIEAYKRCIETCSTSKP